MATPYYDKIAGTSNATFQLGIGTVVALLKWTASKVLFRNKADTAYLGVTLSTVDYFDTAGTNKVTVGFPTGAGADRVLNLPTVAPTAGYFLSSSDGVGGTTWAAGGNTAVCQQTHQVAVAFGSTASVPVGNLPANAVVCDVQVVVDTPFTGGTGATVSVGVTGTLSKYAGTGDSDLTTAGTYDVGSPGVIPNTSAESIIATYSAGGATAGAGRILFTFVIPN